MEFLKVPSFSIGIAVVAKRAAAMIQGPAKRCLDRTGQIDDLRGRQLVGARQRMDAGGKERFVHVNVPQAGDQLLIQQRGFDHAAGLCQPLGQNGGAQRERFGPDRAIIIGRIAQPPNAEELAAVEKLQQGYHDMKAELGKVIVGQEAVIEELLIALFCRGHALLVGVPGLAKTLLISTLAKTLGLSFNRIQFTPDLMPSDITGTEVIEEDKSTGGRSMRFVRGPVFANVILADEINRTPPKTQAALLEAMQEHQVTAGGKQHRLPSRFSCWPRRTRSSRKAPIRCPKPSSTGSCSTSMSAIPPRMRNSRSFG
jgi:hypothetical protein